MATTKKEDLVKTTIYTTQKNVDYFKKKAEKDDRPYSRYIHNILTNIRLKKKAL